MLNPKFRVFIILTFLFIISGLKANILREELLTSIYVSENGKKFLNIDELGDDFFEKKYNKIVYKININKKILQSDIFYLKLSCNIEDFISSNNPYILKNNFPIIKLDKETKVPLLLKFDYKNKISYLSLLTYNEFEYKYILDNEKLLFGLAYGIILCAFLYNFVFFLFNKDKSFLYYSILQISFLLLLLIISFDFFVFNLFEKYGIIIDYLIDILINTIFIISILFNMEFLNTKKYSPKMHKFLWFLFWLNIIDMVIYIIIKQSFLYDYVPSYVFIFILLFSAFLSLKQGYKPAIFYIIGWLSLFIFVFLSETSITDYGSSYLLHIGFPLESLLFSFALGFKVRQVALEKQKNETILINQSKLASMGEMIGNIAHQWRQPLTHLSYIIMNLKAAYENDKLNKNYLQKKTNEANNQIEFMSHTIDDFRNFFKVSKQKEEFSLVSCIKESINLLNASFKSLNIELKFNYENDLKIKTYKGELSQVIFNLLNNTKDEFIIRKIKNPQIIINLSKRNKNILIEILDNAGGIDEKIIKKIFEPYFTTKDKGLGIGLYMSKTIIEKNIEGKLEVKNINDGVKFSIYLADLK